MENVTDLESDFNQDEDSQRDSWQRLTPASSLSLQKQAMMRWASYVFGVTRNDHRRSRHPLTPNRLALNLYHLRHCTTNAITRL